jgi:hypothetical protein
MAKGLRKVYIVVEEKFIFGESNYTSVEIYREKSDADRMCGLKQDKAIVDSQLMWNEKKPIPKYSVHGFYLLHEDLFKDKEKPSSSLAVLR